MTEQEKQIERTFRIMNGTELITKICERLEKRKELVHDTMIVRELSQLTRYDLAQLFKEKKQ